MTKAQLTELIQATVKDTLAAETHEKNDRPTEDYTNIATKLVEACSGVSMTKQPTEKGKKAARFIRALAAGKNDPAKAANWLRKYYPEEAEFAKALTISGEDGTDFILPEEVSTEIIELLSNQTAIRKLNPTVMRMQSQTFMVPKIVGGSTATYLGSDDVISSTKPTFGMLKLVFKKMGAIVPISNDLLRYSNPGADTIVRDDLVSAISQREDQAFIRDDGTENTPKGLLYWCLAANKFNSTGNTLATITADLANAILNLMEGNSRMLRPGWMLAPRSSMRLMSIRDGNGNYAFRDEMLRGTLWGYPFAVSNNIPINIGSAKSEVYFVDFADVVIGESLDIKIDASETAAYSDGTNIISAFSQDQTVIRAIVEHDFGVRHDASVSVIEAVAWAAA